MSSTSERIQCFCGIRYNRGRSSSSHGTNPTERLTSQANRLVLARRRRRCYGRSPGRVASIRTGGRADNCGPDNGFLKLASLRLCKLFTHPAPGRNNNSWLPAPVSSLQAPRYILHSQGRGGNCHFATVPPFRCRAKYVAFIIFTHQYENTPVAMKTNRKTI